MNYISSSARQFAPISDFVKGSGLIRDGDWVESKDQDPEGGVRLIQLADVGVGAFLDKSARFLTAQKAKELRCTYLHSGDILVARMPDPIGRACIFPGDKKKAVTVVDVCIVRPNPKLCDPRWLCWMINAPDFTDSVLQQARGATRQRIARTELERLVVPCISLSEQRRIAAILDEADALRAKRRAALAQFTALTSAIFVDMFGKLRGRATKWRLVPVSDYVAEFQGGKSLEADTDNTRARYRVLKVSAVTSSIFKPFESKPLPEEYLPPPDHFVKCNDLLFSRANTTELVGAVAYVDSTPGNVVLSDKLWRFIWRKPACVEPLFVWALFQTPAVREEIGRRATGTSGSMKNISQGKLLTMQTILPPLQLQSSFVQRLKLLKTLQAQQRTALDQLDSLFASLQHRAFRGEL